MFEAPTLCEGYLKKMSTGMIKRWQKRYFTLAGHYLKYYEVRVVLVDWVFVWLTVLDGAG